MKLRGLKPAVSWSEILSGHCSSAPSRVRFSGRECIKPQKIKPQPTLRLICNHTHLVLLYPVVNTPLQKAAKTHEV